MELYFLCFLFEFIKLEFVVNNRVGFMQNSIELIYGRKGLMIFKIKYVY